MYGLPFFALYGKLRERMKCKVVTTMHNVLSQNQKFEGNPIKTFFRKTLYRFQNRIIRKNSDVVIVHAEFFKKILVNEYNFPKEKVVVLRQGILEDIKITQKNKTKKQLKLKGKVYLIIGSLVPDHGADIVLKQANEIDGTIVVAASDRAINDRNDDRQALWLAHLKEIVKVNKIKNVRFDIREIPYSLWWKYFSAADVVLLPYKGGIGSGIFADCIATRTPMIGSDIKYFREFAMDWNFIRIAETGKICGNNISTRCDYAQAIEGMLPEDINDEFDKYIRKYGMTALAKKYKEIYNG